MRSLVTRTLHVLAVVLVTAWPLKAGGQTPDSIGQARQLALRGDFHEATSLLERTLATEPSNLDAVVMLTYVELWSGHAASAERRAAVALATNQNNVDLLLARALALRQLNREPEAFDLLQRARALAPNRTDVRDAYELMRFDVTGSELSMTADNETWSDGRGTWREGQFLARQNTRAGTGVLLASEAGRAGLTDEQLAVELYPRLPIGYLFVGGT